VTRRMGSFFGVSVVALLLVMVPLGRNGLVALAHAGGASPQSMCSSTLIGAAPWNAACYRSQIPTHLLDSAPFTVTDPRQVVSSITGLPLSGIYVARLGSDDPTIEHPLGPLMMVEYVFGTFPPPSGTHDSSHSYVAVWEDGYQRPSHGGLDSGNGVYSEQVDFGNRRMEMSVTTNGPRPWETTLVHRISRAVRSEPSRPAPRLRL
jgi:hypothetical protein